MRISDWSSDVCSSDLFDGAKDVNAEILRQLLVPRILEAVGQRIDIGQIAFDDLPDLAGILRLAFQAIGLEHEVEQALVIEQVVQRFHGADIFPVVIDVLLQVRSEEHTSELQSLMRISYAVFC